MKIQVIASLFVLASVSAVPTLAWSQDQHADHQPDATAASPAAKAPTAPPKPVAKGTPAMGGMGSCGMMMGGMMPGGGSGMPGMMGSGPGAGGMMQDRGPGGMMPGGGSGMRSMMMDDMKMSEHIEDRVRELRGALGITAAQAGAWDNFAQALRGAAGRMDAAHQKMNPQDAAKRRSAVECLDRHDRMLTQVHDMLRALRPSLVRLYGTLSPAQQAKADELLVLPQAMMPRMGMGDMMGRKP